MEKMKIPVRWKIAGCMGIALLGFGYSDNSNHPAVSHAAEKSTAAALHEICAEDDRLELISHETYEYDRDSISVGTGVDNAYTRVSRIYDDEEIAGISHAYFDEQNRLLYVLGYSSGILEDSISYCEENIYMRDDEEHTCRYVYCKSGSRPYKDGYYVASRYLFEVSDHQFDEKGRLLGSLCYRRNVGSDPNGYSEELFFSRGYQADYDGAYLMAELQYYDYWGTNEVGVWEYRIYQYDELGNRILEVSVTEEEIRLFCCEYPEDTGQMEVYTYQVTADWEFSCDDGSTYYLCPDQDKTAVRKVAADGTVERELFYGKAMDLGQQHYLMPEDVEAAMEDHMYVVKPGDCLWKIAYRAYGHGTYCDLLYRVNRDIIGREEDLLMPGTRLYIPEVGNAQDTKTTYQ